MGSGVALGAVQFRTGGQDVIMGTDGEDVVHGGGGWDVISGRGGDDVIFGDEGADAVRGGRFRLEEIFDGNRMVPDGEDRLFGGDGADCVWGGLEDYMLYGGAGNDFVGPCCLDFVMDTGNDIMYAGSGNDHVMALEASFRPAPLSRRRISSSAVLAQTPSTTIRGFGSGLRLREEEPALGP